MRTIAFSALCTLTSALAAAPATAPPADAPMTCPKPADPARDGRRDFDFEFGDWTTQLKVLRNPLSGESAWVEYEGTSIVRKVLDGRANLIELSVEGESGRIEGLSLRLYDPQSRQWSLNFANTRTGVLTESVTGAFNGGCGEFYGQETLDGRIVLVRFVIKQISPRVARFEQAYSADGGRSWEVNWIATDTRR